MKKANLFIIVIIAIAAFGCDENKVFEEHSGEFPNYRWEKSVYINFDPEIDDTDSKYQILVAFRHVHGFQLKKLKLGVNITSPSGKVQNKKYKLKVAKNATEYYSDCAGDYCDLVEVVEKKFKFKEKGKYTFEIGQITNVDPLPNVMKVGLIINKVVKEKKENE